ncbi:MAG: DUF2497 domain-containing protein [Geminicoccaceae bacterium]|nr:DUF2497 domain-containing protein [Geminicoccaceae bacterium]
MTSTTKGDQEPSMEEILSSIRRIIADEQEGAAPAATAAKERPSLPSEADEDDVLDLTQVVNEGGAPPAEDEGFDDDIGFEPPTATEPPAVQGEGVKSINAASAEPRQVEEETVLNMHKDEDEMMVSGETASRSTNAFARLARAASGADERRPLVADGGRTVEAFLADMLRPMLKEWLDQNLEGVVERVVEQEVKKLARRAELL